MTTDGVERERGALLVHGADVAERHETQLHERLETVADAQHEAVAVLQQVAHRFGDGRSAEERRDELGRAVGLVAAGEPAGDHDDLAVLDGLHQRLGALGHLVGGQIVDDERLGHSSRLLEGARRIVLAVVAREHGDDDARARDGAVVHQRRGTGEGHRFHGIALGAVREHRLEVALPRFLQPDQVDDLAAGGELVGLGRLAHLVHAHDVGRMRQLHARSQLHEEAAVRRGEQLVGRHRISQLHADAVAHAHLEQSLSRRAVSRRGHGQRRTVADQALHQLERLHQAGGVGRDTVVRRGRDAHHAAARLLELGRRRAIHRADGRGERHQRGRHVQLLETARHGVLAADGADTQVHLRHQRAQHGGGGLAPALGLVAQLLEVLLERQVHVLVEEAGGHEARHALHHGDVRAGELVRLSEVGVEAPGHAADRGGLAEHGQLRHHGHGRRQLTRPAERHEHRARADGRVEALGQALVRAHVQVGDQRVHALGQRVARPGALVRPTRQHAHVLVLRRAVAVEEVAAHVHDGGAVPLHAHARLLRHRGDRGCLEVLFVRVADELVHVLGRQGNGHALLALGDGQLGAVKAVVLLRHLVEVDEQAVGQLADGHGHAARAEVVAALDQLASVAPTEQALDLALHGRVALLHLGAAAFERFQLVRLRGTRGAADAVAAGAAAQQHHHVARRGRLATHVIGRGGAHHGADLHALRGVTGMVQLVHLAGRQADLVAV